MRCAGIKQSFITRLQMRIYTRIRPLRKTERADFTVSYAILCRKRYCKSCFSQHCIPCHRCFSGSDRYRRILPFYHAETLGTCRYHVYPGRQIRYVDYGMVADRLHGFYLHPAYGVNSYFRAAFTPCHRYG